MGPPVTYVKRGNADPIPFTGALAFGYKKEFIIENMRVIRICSEYNMDREMVYNEEGKRPDPFWKAMFTSWQDEPFNQELQEIIHHWGYEITCFNTGSFRQGLMFDEAGSRTEHHLGFGVSWLNHFNIDWYIIHSPYGSIARDKQWGFSITFMSFFKWSEKDLMWWMKE
jgi:hypothetical protein